MSSFAVKLLVAEDPNNIAFQKDDINETLYDKFEPLPDPLSLPVSEWRIKSFDDIVPYMASDEPVTANRITLDLRNFENDIPRLIVYLSPIMYRWEGTELFVILPYDGPQGMILASFADLLRSMELRAKGLRIISCPTCARCRTDFPEMVKSIEAKLHGINKPLDVAIMGCEVNGPGEARAADIGIAWGDQKGMLFKHGESVRVVNIEDSAQVLLEELEKM